MNFNQLIAGLQMIAASIFKAQKPKVDMSAMDDLNKFLAQVANGYFGTGIADALQRVRVKVTAAVAEEAPGAVPNTLALTEALLAEVAKDPTFLAAKSNIALRQALADLEVKIGAMRAALQ